jgi:hypothetical protein
MICKHETYLQVVPGSVVSMLMSSTLWKCHHARVRLNPASLIGSILTTFRLIAAIVHDRGPRPGVQIRTIYESYSRLSLPNVVTVRGQPR